jgi:hypothetical protein
MTRSHAPNRTSAWLWAAWKPWPNCKRKAGPTAAYSLRTSSSVGPDRTHLIHLALARGGRVPERYDFPYRGCLVHYEAPAIARSVLATGEAEPAQEADIYALGASLLISATGRRARSARP